MLRISSEIASDFTFVAGVAASGYAEMYNMHDAQQTSNGTIIAFDCETPKLRDTLAGALRNNGKRTLVISAHWWQR